MDTALNDSYTEFSPKAAEGPGNQLAPRIRQMVGPDLGAVLRVSKNGRKGESMPNPTHLICWIPWFPDSAVAMHITPSIPKEFS